MDSSCHTRPATHANSPPHRQGQLLVEPLEWVPVPQGRLVLQTLRSHDQYNTTIYGLDDRYRGVQGGRRVVFVNPDDIATMGLTEGQRVDLVSEFADAEARAGTTSRGFPHRAVSPPRWATPRPTTRRPTRLCRWTMSPPSPTRRCPRPSSPGTGSAGMGRVTSRRLASHLTDRRAEVARTERRCRRAA